MKYLIAGMAVVLPFFILITGLFALLSGFSYLLVFIDQLTTGKLLVGAGCLIYAVMAISFSVGIWVMTTRKDVNKEIK